MIIMDASERRHQYILRFQRLPYTLIIATTLFDLMYQLKNPYIGFARFRAAFAGEACSEWSVIPSDGYLKQKEETHFAVTFKPQNPGVSVGYLVIETEVSRLELCMFLTDGF